MSEFKTGYTCPNCGNHYNNALSSNQHKYLQGNEVNHGLKDSDVKSFIDRGYEPKVLKYYTNDGQDPVTKRWNNYISEIHGMAKLVKHHMGGNYGAATEWELVNSDGWFKVQYYGDSSASVTKIEL